MICDEEYQICVGGTNELAQGIARMIERWGAKVVVGARVARVLVENGKATGVQLADGSTIRSRIVVSNAGFTGTMLNLVGEEHLAPGFVQEVKNLHPPVGGSFNLHLAVSELPVYRVPEARESLCIFLGFEGFADLQVKWSEIERGVLPAKPSFHCGSTTTHDPSCAPPGAHTLYLWEQISGKVSQGMTEEMAQEYGERVLKRWREYSPNLTEDRILGKYLYRFGKWKNQQVNSGGLSLSRGQYYHRRPLPGFARLSNSHRGVVPLWGFEPYRRRCTVRPCAQRLPDHL